MDLARWFENVTPDVKARLGQNPDSVDGPQQHAIHLAVLVEPYLSLVLEGSKTIESRFASARIAPYRCVDIGDSILLKEASGPIVATTRVAEVWFFRDHPRLDVDLHQRFGAALRDDVPGFWSERRHAKYATLIRLTSVVHLSEPLSCPKTDRRGWVVLRDRSDQLMLFG